MPEVLAFCRLVLGESAAADVAASQVAPAPGAERPELLGAAWSACARELTRRREVLDWDQPPSDGPLARLASLPEDERGAVAAQALGASPDDVALVLRLDPAAVDGVLARAHGALVAAGGDPDATVELAKLRRAVGQDEEPALARERRAASLSVPPRLRRAASVRIRSDGGRGLAVLEPSSLRARVAVALAVLLVAGLAGFAAVSALRGDDGSGSSTVVTATPVGPLPPGVK